MKHLLTTLVLVLFSLNTFANDSSLFPIHFEGIQLSDNKSVVLDLKCLNGDPDNTDEVHNTYGYFFEGILMIDYKEYPITQGTIVFNEDMSTSWFFITESPLLIGVELHQLKHTVTYRGKLHYNISKKHYSFPDPNRIENMVLTSTGQQSF